MGNLCISSLVVKTRPASLEKVQASIESIPGVEVFGRNEDGRLVVVLDSIDSQQASNTISDIQNRADILSASLIYQYDDQFESQLEALP